MKESGGEDAKACIQAGYKRALYKNITPAKQAVLEKLYTQAFSKFGKDSKAAAAFLQAPEPKKGMEHLAALTVVANAIMNLDEFLSKS
jgi:hypothetical protein